ncbi:hypothetical protein [Scytonema millei]|nr:hypothetical protein [Scytonema millei]
MQRILVVIPGRHHTRGQSEFGRDNRNTWGEGEQIPMKNNFTALA